MAEPLSPKVGESPTSDIADSAREFADQVRTIAGKERPVVVAALKVGDKIYTAGNRPRSTIHPDVQRVLDEIPEVERAPNIHGKCAELQCMSSALEDGLTLNGSSITAVKVRGSGSSAHGESMRPCASCQAVLIAFGVEGIDA